MQNKTVNCTPDKACLFRCFAMALPSHFLQRDMGTLFYFHESGNLLTRLPIFSLHCFLYFNYEILMLVENIFTENECIFISKRQIFTTSCKDKIV